MKVENEIPEISDGSGRKITRREISFETKEEKKNFSANFLRMEIFTASHLRFFFRKLISLVFIPSKFSLYIKYLNRLLRMAKSESV
jgi:hypothetical protein